MNRSPGVSVARVINLCFFANTHEIMTTPLRNAFFSTRHTEICTPFVLSCDLLQCNTCLFYSVSGHNGHKPKRPKPKRPQTETATDQNGHKPKRPQTETATNRNGHKPKRPQTEKATNRNGHKPKRPQITKCMLCRRLNEKLKEPRTVLIFCPLCIWFANCIHVLNIYVPQGWQY